MARRAARRWLIALVLASAANAADEAPSLELLLHLAEFADAEGRPLDPERIAAAMESIDPAAAGIEATARPAPAGAVDPPRADQSDHAASAEATRAPQAETERPSRNPDEPN